MSDILQITTPITPREYQNTNRQNQSQNQPADTNQVFNLGDQTKIVKTNERGGDYAEQDLKDSAQLNMPKSASGPGSASGTIDTVKELLSASAMAALKEKGDTAMMNKISAFAEEVILKPENLMRDMVNQQENSTIFSGKMWDALRELVKNESPDMQSAVMDFVRAAADNESKGELLESLSANFKYLSQELAPSKAVSDELMKASEALRGPDAARNFTAVKSTLVQLVNYTSDSLLLDNKSQNLLPLVIHNISRYNNNPSSLRMSFDTVLEMFDSLDLPREQLDALADALGITPESANEKAPVSDGAEPSPNSIHGADTAPAEAAADEMPNTVRPETPDFDENLNVPKENTASENTADISSNTSAPADDTEAAVPDKSDHAASDGHEIPDDVPAGTAAETAGTERPAAADAVRDPQDSRHTADTKPESRPAAPNRESTVPRTESRGFFRSLFGTPAETVETPSVTKEQIRSGLEKAFDDYIIAGRFPQDVKKSSIISSATVKEQARLEDMTKLLTIGVTSMARRLNAARLKDTLSGIDPRRGSSSVKLALASVTPNTPAMAEALESIVSNYDRTGDLQSLIDRLGNIINSIEDMDKKLPLAQTLNEALAGLAEKSGSNYKPPTSIDILSDFLLKNIDDPSLRSITAMNKTDMIQTMLTSPGVFNPLMHFFVPLDAFGMRSFAELWVDRNADKNSRSTVENDDETSHVFMCFDMENVGYFELEMFAKGKNLSVMLLCPEGKEAAFEELKTAVPKIAAGVGYTVGTTIVDTLYKKRSLSKIFPRLRTAGGEFHANA